MLETLTIIGFATYGLATLVNHQPITLNIREWVWLLLVLATGVILSLTLFDWTHWYVGLGGGAVAHLLLKLEDLLMVATDVLFSRYTNR